MYKISSLLCGLLLAAVCQPGQAQNLGNAPYSQQGFGEINNTPGNIRNFGMGNVGVSTPNSVNANVQNPALLHFVSRVSFEVAGIGQTKSISNGRESKTTGNGGLGYLALALPITKFWHTAIGLRPYSSVNYSTSQTATVPGAPATPTNPTTIVRTGNSGEGTLSEVYFSNSIRIAKGLTVGATGSYLFGAINRYATSRLEDSAGISNGQEAVYNQRVNYSDLLFKGGASYRQPLGKKVNMTLGAVYGLETDVNYKSKNLIQRRRSADLLQIDELPLDSTNGETRLPGFLEAGLSFDNAQNWVVGLEFSTRDWSGYSGPGTEAGELGKSYRLGLGAELVPDPSSVDSYLKRVSYRAGVSYTQTPYLTNGGEAVNGVALHTGLALPIGSVPRPPEYNQSFINLGLSVGRTGNTATGNLSEKYLRFMVGLTLNSSWFIKPKFD